MPTPNEPYEPWEETAKKFLLTRSENIFKGLSKLKTKVKTQSSVKFSKCLKTKKKIVATYDTCDTRFFKIILKIKLFSRMKTLFHFHLCKLLVPLPIFFCFGLKISYFKEINFQRDSLLQY